MSRLLVFGAILCASTAPPTASPSHCSLYDDSPVGVVCFHGDEVTTAIATGRTSWLVEFYSSWCGHCQHFAPTWKKLAKDVSGWSSVVQLGVIDCSAKESFSTCNKFGIGGYPSLRFYRPGVVDLKATPTSYRGPRTLLDLEKGIVGYVGSLEGDIPSHFTPLEGGHLLAVGEKVWLQTAIVFEEEESYIGRMLMMDMLKFKQLKFYRTLNTNLVLVNHYSIMEFPSLVIETRKDDYVIIPGHSLTDPRREFGEAIQRHLLNTTHTIISTASQTPSTDLVVTTATHARLTRMNRVSPVDVLGAISYIFRREVPLHSTVSGSAFTALLRLTHLLENALSKAYPAAVPGLSLVRERLEVRLSAGFITSRDWTRLVETKLNDSIFPRSPEWHNCRGSQPHYRGYPCSLWSLAHTLTLLTLPTHTGDRETDATPLSPKMTFRSKDALFVVSRFIKNFFSCESCRQHFAEMSRTLDAGRVVYDGDAVLWLWEAHNTVNRRLARDISTDPLHPKTPFPSLEHCPYCYQRMTSQEGVSEYPGPNWTNIRFRSRSESLLAQNVTVDRRNVIYTWNRTAVFLYLWSYYHWNRTHSLTHRDILQGAWPRVFTEPRHLYPRSRTGGLGFSSYDLGLCVTYYVLCGGILVVLGYWLLRRRLRQRRYFLHP